jgi:hypothetical protein
MGFINMTVERILILADNIKIYDGLMTGMIISFAKQFYKHRQKRWQLIVEGNLYF